jgi:DNA-directed RNA polymerase subunit F
MSDNEVFTDFSSVRDLLLDAQERRGFLTYEQKAALQHAEWAASDNRNGYRTEPKVFQDMLLAILEIEKFQKYPELAAKLAELMPMHSDDVRAVAASRRISIENEEIEAVLDIVRQHVGVE